MKNTNNYLNTIRENKKYRINIKDIKKLYRIEKKRVSLPPFEIVKEIYVPTAESEGEERQALIVSPEKNSSLNNHF
jgi:hypothetical protein